MGKLVNRIPELLQRKGLRDNKRYSQREMAEGTELTDAAISRIMNSRTLDHLTLLSALAIAAWLEVHVEELVHEENE
jgi:transcriptional regulator with XRE-family HTH domain